MMPFEEVSLMVENMSLLPTIGLQVLYNTCNQVKDVEGIAVELGVYRGGSLKLIAKCLPDKQVYGFDSFEGIQQISKNDNGIAHEVGTFANSLEQTWEYLSDCNNISLCKGLVYKTLIAIKNKKICLLHVDLDVFEPTLFSLTNLWEKIVRGGVILVHDYEWKHTPGIKLAVDKFCEEFDVKGEKIDLHPYPSYFQIIKE